MSWDSIERTIYKKVVVDGVEYLGDEIVNIEIDSSITDGSSLKIGTVNSSKCSIKIKTENDITQNAKVIPSISLDGVVWEKLGVFYIDNRARNGAFVELTCFDKLYLAGKQFATNTNIPMDGTQFLEMVTIQELLDDICNVIGINTDIVLVSDNRDFFDSIPSYTMTMREILGNIAGTQGGCMTIDREGKLVLVKFDKPLSKAINASLHSNCEEINIYKNISQVHVSFQDILSYRIGNDTNETMDISNFLLTIFAYDWNNLIENQLPIRYDPISVTYRGDPTLKLGDRIDVILRNGKTLTTYILENKLKIGIGLSQEINAPSDTVQESEFGRFNIVDEIERAKRKVEEVEERADRVEEEVGIDPEDEGKLFKLVLLGNAEEGVHYTLEIKGNYPREEIPWGESVRIDPVGSSRIYINGSYKQFGTSFRMWKDNEFSISTDVIDYFDLPQIWIESQEPTNEGKDGDIWVVI